MTFDRSSEMSNDMESDTVTIDCWGAGASGTSRFLLGAAWVSNPLTSGMPKGDNIPTRSEFFPGSVAALGSFVSGLVGGLAAAQRVAVGGLPQPSR